MGAWIEIMKECALTIPWLSLPSWERGLKYKYGYYYEKPIKVAPFMGAWIEIRIGFGLDWIT